MDWPRDESGGQSSSRTYLLNWLAALAGGGGGGGQTERYKDSIKNPVRPCYIPVKGWEHLAPDRSAWRLATHNGAQALEERRLSQLDMKRQARKERKANTARHQTPSQEREAGQHS